MKKFIIILALVFSLVKPAYAVNVVDTMVCKKVVLRGNGKTVLVNRLTGEVKYMKQRSNKWKLLRGQSKKAMQRMYNVQVATKKRSRK